MKRTLIIILFLCLLVLGVRPSFPTHSSGAVQNTNIVRSYAPMRNIFVLGSTVATAARGVQSSTAKLGLKFYAGSTNPLSGCDIYLTKTGNPPTSTTYSFEIDADSSDAPSGTALASTTAAALATTTTGWMGLQSFQVNTGNLTVNNAYWLVMTRVGGTAPTSSSNYMSATQSGTNYSGIDKIRQFNGTNWTTVAAVAQTAVFVCQDNAGNYYGDPVTASAAASAGTKVFGGGMQELQFKYGAQVTPKGVYLNITKTGNPQALVVTLYSGSTAVASTTIASSTVPTGTNFRWLFPTPITLAPNVTAYMSLSQLNAGGDASNNYNLTVYPMATSTYLSAVNGANYNFRTGSSSDPAALTITNEIPALQFIFDDPSTDLSIPTYTSSWFN